MQNQYDDSQFEDVADDNRLKLTTYDSGDAIIVDGDSSNFACKLLSGTAKVIRQGDVVATIRPGEYFGAIAAITGSRRSATVVASSRCVVEKIDEKTFKSLIQKNPDLLDKIL